MSSLIARKLAAMQMITVAAPSYLERYGHPKHPDELNDHACIHFRDPLSGQAYDWEFHKGREVITVPTKSRLMVSDAGTMFTEGFGRALILNQCGLKMSDVIGLNRLCSQFATLSDAGRGRQYRPLF